MPPPAAQTLDATLTATNHPSETARTTPGSSKAEVTSETDTNQTPQPSKINSFDPALAGEGQALYDKLRKQYPDAKILPDHDLAPHTIFIDTIAYLPAQGRLDLYMPSGIWNKLNDQEKKSLAELLRAKIVEARQSPEKFATLDPRAPAYPNEIGNIRTMPDNSWQIHTGQLDDEGYLNEDDLVAQGSDYSNKITESSVLTYAASDAPVHNSLLNGSVAQVEEYHKKHLNDPDSVEYSNWTKVIETGAGYQVSVTFRSKNEAGGYVIHDQTFSFNKQGEITEVRDNE